MQLERNNVGTWVELDDSFAKQYKYITDMVSNRTQLQNMSKKGSEYFKAYAQWWRKLAARVHQPLVDYELIDLFMGTLQGQYYERLISSVSTGFYEMMIFGERVEEGLKSGKIQGGSSSQARVRKPFNGYKKNEYEAHAISSQREIEQHRAPVPIPYYLYMYKESSQYPVMPYPQAIRAPFPA